jgi:glycine/D-amino acid oxidase-like deaminating enzyme
VFRRGVFFPEGATVQPARLVHAMRRRALDAGVALHEHSPATLRSGEVRTPRGRVRARETVVAINAAATGWRPVARHVTNFGSYVVLTEPVPELLEEIGWIGGEASDLATAARAERGLRRLLPGLAQARIERAWGGPIDVSADHLPFFGTVPGRGRVHYGLGYSGHGVGPSWLGGQILASLALGRDDEWTSLPLVTRRVPSLPPEPLKRLGGGLVRSAIMACEAAEEDGRRAPLPARAGAALPRLLRMQIGTR